MLVLPQLPQAPVDPAGCRLPTLAGTQGCCPVSGNTDANCCPGDCGLIGKTVAALAAGGPYTALEPGRHLPTPWWL